jgi:hypothetical protein
MRINDNFEGTLRGAFLIVDIGKQDIRVYKGES